jgi:hypothetical protein
MKTNKKIIGSIKLLFFLFLFFFSLPQGIKAQVTCGYPFTNNLTCAVDVTFEFNSSTCAATCAAPGIITINCPPGLTILNGPGCCTGAVDIHLQITDFDGQGGTSAIITPNGGCNGTIPSSDNGSIPATANCGGSTYNISANSAGATVW